MVAAKVAVISQSPNPSARAICCLFLSMNRLSAVLAIYRAVPMFPANSSSAGACALEVGLLSQTIVQARGVVGQPFLPENAGLVECADYDGAWRHRVGEIEHVEFQSYDIRKSSIFPSYFTAFKVVVSRPVLGAGR